MFGPLLGAFGLLMVIRMGGAQAVHHSRVCFLSQTNSSGQWPLLAFIEDLGLLCRCQFRERSFD